MRYRVACLIACGLVAGPVVADGQQSFEGSITYRMVRGADTMTMRQFTKGSHTRTELRAPGMPGDVYTLMDVDEKIVRTVMPSLRGYFEMDSPLAASRPSTRTAGDIVRVGATSMVSGIRCEHFRFGSGAGQVEACIATGLGWLPSAVEQVGVELAVLRRQFPDGMIPLRLSRQESGRWVPFLEAISVDPSRLEPTLFEVPAGYRKMPPPQ